MVIVFPNGSIHGNLQQVKDPDQDPFTPELLTVIIPYIESHYHVSTSPDDRAIAGLSMGGHQTLYTGLTHTEKPEVVGQIMTEAVRTVSKQLPIAELVDFVSTNGHRHIPVVDHERRLAGIITNSDLIAGLYRARLVETGKRA